MEFLLNFFIGIWLAMWKTSPEMLKYLFMFY